MFKQNPIWIGLLGLRCTTRFPIPAQRLFYWCLSNVSCHLRHTTIFRFDWFGIGRQKQKLPEIDYRNGSSNGIIHARGIHLQTVLIIKSLNLLLSFLIYLQCCFKINFKKPHESIKTHSISEFTNAGFDAVPF